MSYSLLTAEDGPAFTEIRESTMHPLLLVCDHAGNRIPQRLGDLGLPPAALNDHIGWDIGAARVTELMAAHLGCAAILCRFSRLVIDANRAPDKEDAIPAISHGTVIPSNNNMSHEERQARIDEISAPFHHAVAAALARLDRAHMRAGIAAIHSFSPQPSPDSAPRPWDIGVVWNKDSDTAGRLLAYLRQNTSLTLGDNEPYSMKKLHSYTLERHAEGWRPSILIEIRNDHLHSEQGRASFARLLAGFFAATSPL